MYNSKVKFFNIIKNLLFALFMFDVQNLNKIETKYEREYREKLNFSVFVICYIVLTIFKIAVDKKFTLQFFC